jgi:hypothetical protein
VVVAAMELGIAMLEGGNRKVQMLAMTGTFSFFCLTRGSPLYSFPLSLLFLCGGGAQ